MRRLGFQVLLLGVVTSIPGFLNGEAKAPDTIEMTGSPLGGVKFQHKLHDQRTAGKCIVCHHASKPEKPGDTKQACDKCHSKPLPAGMKTTRQGAFHKPNAQSGNCIDCHKKETRPARRRPSSAWSAIRKAKPDARRRNRYRPLPRLDDRILG